MTGPPPLDGLKVLEFAGLAPGPFAGMLLADAGASVLRVDRAVSGNSPLPTGDMLARHKSSITVDLKSRAGVAMVRELSKSVDVLIDPFRPGVMEKLGLGPDTLLAGNPRLIYGRMTGFRRDGKYAQMAGHDINYLSISGVLGLLGRDGERPHPPLNILADFAGGGATLFQGILLALLARQTTGKGQVVEANMVDGSSYLATFPRYALKTPLGNRGRGRNLLDGGCPYYDTYQTRDGLYMAVGALEPQFFKALIQGLGIENEGWEAKRHDPDEWPALRQRFDAVFRSKTRPKWERIFDGTDACCTPVLDYAELEMEKSREGDQRAAVTLLNTPCLSPKSTASDTDDDQTSKTTRAGYVGEFLVPGQGGEQLLRHWLGWTKGQDYDVEAGGLVLKEGKSKL